MEKRGERKEGVPVLALAKCLLASYVLTLLLLCLLALLLYKLHLTEGMVTIAIYLCHNYLYGGIFGRKKDEDAEVSLGSTARGSIFRDTGGGIRIDQNAGNCIGQFLLDHNGIVCGRGDTGRNVRVKYRNGQEFNGF